jgi:capsular exopolysaccharide synthesis family protein
VEALKGQLTASEIELIKARQEYTETDPTIIALKNQIANLRRQLQHQVEFETSTKANVPNTIKSGILQQIAQLKGTVAASDSQIAAVQRAMASAKEELKALPDREYRLGRLIQDATSLQQSYNLLNETYGNLQIQEQAKVANARQRFEAEPGLLVAPKKARILMLTVPLACILAFLLAALVDRLDGRVHSDHEVETATGLPVMAHIPEISRSEDHRLLGPTSTTENFRLAESFQMLRTSISFSAYDKPIQTILISSSLPGEGKSTCAMNLAIASALSGERVILVDCDLRRPAAHRLLKLPNRVGFTSVVAGTATLEEALQETNIPGLRILSSGPTPPNPFRMLHSRGARELLDQLRNEADFIIIDTPPALGMADAQLLATASDAILLVVSAKGAKKYEISRTRDLLGQTNVEVLGAILNRVESSFHGYHSQDAYGRYALNGDSNGQQNGAGHDGEDEGQPEAAEGLVSKTEA